MSMTCITGAHECTGCMTCQLGNCSACVRCGEAAEESEREYITGENHLCTACVKKINEKEGADHV